MTHQSAANNSFHFVAFRGAKRISNSLPVRATLAFALLLGSGKAVSASTVSGHEPLTVTATVVKTTKVRKVKKPAPVRTVPLKPAPVKPVFVQPESQGNSGATSSAIFGQQEVDQNKFIALAVPHAGNRYQLVILEQVSPKKACWSETETPSVTLVKPLLLNFDFTGICGRSTDTNGYSIRMAGQDLGVQYDVDILRRGDQLVLVGTNFRDRNAPKIEIGKTSGISDGLLKINLEPGWRFSKRSYGGKLLGHIYLTSDSLFQNNN